MFEGKCTCVDLSPFDPVRFTPGAVRGNRNKELVLVSSGSLSGIAVVVVG
jgi:hypothetical protein